MRWSDGHAAHRDPDDPRLHRRSPDTLWPDAADAVEPAPLLGRDDDDLCPLDDYLAGAVPAPGAAVPGAEPVTPVFAERPAPSPAPSSGEERSVHGMRYATRPPTVGGPEPAPGDAPPPPATPDETGAEAPPAETPPADAGAAGADAEDGATLAARVEALEREKEVLQQLLADRQDDVGAAVARLEAAAVAVREQMTGSIVRLASLIARRVIERELEADPDLVVTLTRSAVAQLENCTTAEVRVHPTDYAAVQRHLARGSEHVEYPIIRVVGDGAVPRGGCVVVTDGAEVDGLLETRLRRLEETLRDAMTTPVAVAQERA